MSLYLNPVAALVIWCRTQVPAQAFETWWCPVAGCRFNHISAPQFLDGFKPGLVCSCLGAIVLGFFFFPECFPHIPRGSTCSLPLGLCLIWGSRSPNYQKVLRWCPSLTLLFPFSFPCFVFLYSTCYRLIF